MYPPITTTYLLIFVSELPDDGRLCKGALVVLVGFPYILLAFKANPFGAPLAGRRDVGGEDMVRGMKRGARWEEIVNRWPFSKRG